MSFWLHHFRSVIGHRADSPGVGVATLLPDCSGVELLGLSMFQPYDIIRAAKSLRPKKSCGIDCIPMFLVKGCADILAEVLCNFSIVRW